MGSRCVQNNWGGFSKAGAIKFNDLFVSLSCLCRIYEVKETIEAVEFTVLKGPYHHDQSRALFQIAA